LYTDFSGILKFKTFSVEHSIINEKVNKKRAVPLKQNQAEKKSYFLVPTISIWIWVTNNKGKEIQFVVIIIFMTPGAFYYGYSCKRSCVLFARETNF